MAINLKDPAVDATVICCPDISVRTIKVSFMREPPENAIAEFKIIEEAYGGFAVEYDYESRAGVVKIEVPIGRDTERVAEEIVRCLSEDHGLKVARYLEESHNGINPVEKVKSFTNKNS